MDNFKPLKAALEQIPETNVSAKAPRMIFYRYPQSTAVHIGKTVRNMNLMCRLDSSR